jgi:hypothetical protein
MILQECAPGLRRRLAAVHHVLADAALADIDAEFEQFTVNAGCTPSGILPAHLANQISDLTGDGRWSRLANMLDLPRPEEAKAGTMPGQNRLLDPKPAVEFLPPSLPRQRRTGRGLLPGRYERDRPEGAA